MLPENGSAPATKNDLAKLESVLKSDISKLEGALNTKFDAKIDALDKKIDTVATTVPAHPFGGIASTAPKNAAKVKTGPGIACVAPYPARNAS